MTLPQSDQFQDYFENEAYPPPSNLTVFAQQLQGPKSSENRYRWPWLVSLGGRCVGSLLGPRFVLVGVQNVPGTSPLDLSDSPFPYPLVTCFSREMLLPSSFHHLTI